MGCWTPTTSFGVEQDTADCSAQLLAEDGSAFRVAFGDGDSRDVHWSHCGRHNIENALAALAAARHAGVTLDVAVAALEEFQGVKRRLELLGRPGDVALYDDFAHHPTAIATTLQGLRARAGSGRVIALIEPRSNTMRMGEHRQQLAAATKEADSVYWFQPSDMDWSLESMIGDSPVPATVVDDVDALVTRVAAEVVAGDQVVIMSNGGFGGIHQKLLNQLQDAVSL